MRIALVNNYYYLRGGSERVLFGDQHALVSRGHAVRPFSVAHPQTSAEIPSADLVESFDHTEGGIRQQLLAAANMVYSRRAGRVFGRFLDSDRFDVVHCHNIYGRLSTAVLDEAARRGIPVVLTVHDLKLVCPAYLGLRNGEACHRCADGRYWRCLRWKCHKRSFAASLVYTVESYFNRLRKKYDPVARFLCPSRFIQKMLQASGVSAQRTLYHPNALSVADYCPRYDPGDYVLYAGRLSPEKGILTLLAATSRTGIPLRIAGTGPLEAQIRQHIAAGRLPVTLEGYCSGARLAELYRNCAFTVIPSEWYENAPMAALESFAYGKPVVASNLGGNPELVIDGETGRLFTPKQVGELAEISARMWSDREGLIAMGRHARELLEQRFNQEQRVSNLLAAYGDVIQNCRNR